MVGEVPKLIFRGRKITFRRTFFCILATAMVFRKMTPGVGLVVGEVPKLIFRGGKIVFEKYVPIVIFQLPWFSPRLLFEARFF